MRAHTVAVAGNDAALSHTAGKQYLTYGVVDFVCAGVIEVFAFEVDFTTVFFRQPLCQVEG